jgi:hypothetical protein
VTNGSENTFHNLGEVIQLIESMWWNSAQRGEAGQYVTWFCLQ